MGKKKTAAASKATAKAAKRAKAAQKVEKKEKKKGSKSKDVEDDDQDLESILEKMRVEWEEAHKVTEELVEGPPSRRANATLTACPNGNHLWCIGGEFFSEDGKAYFYNDTFRYAPEKDEWRKFISPTCPGPRSAHAVAATAAGGGKIFLFGGEFSSLHQTTFHHYRDFWVFDIPTHSWDRIDTKIRPTARSGHRMAMWKHYVVLFGGFFDPGMTTRYLNDLWIFDTQEYNWRLVEFKENELKPSPRSGFSFLSTPEGITLYGGYCKEYIKGKRPIGVMLEDTWLLKMSLQEPDETEAGPGPPSSSAAWAKSKGLKSARSGPGKKDPLSIKWERRKRPSTAYAPALRSGCTMTAWAAKSMGVMFGGVTDEDTNEETLESVFWNDLNGYQWSGKGRWVSLTLKKGKKVKKGPKWDRQKAKAGPGVTTLPSYRRDEELDDMETLDGTETTDGTETVIGSEDIAGDSDDDGNDDEDDLGKERELGKLVSKVRTISLAELQIKAAAASRAGEDIDPDDPILTTPLPRYNAMLAVLRNSLFIYGGIYEKGSREYTLDDFYSIQLDKMDRFVCLKESGIVIPDGDVESSSDEDDDDDDDEEDDDEDDGSTMGDEDEEERVAKKEPISEEDDGDEDTEKEDVENVEVNLRSQAAAFMGVARDAARSPEDVISTPLPGETLAMFYARSREYWTQKAHDTSDNKGKQLKREAFKLAEERYAAYKPILEEVEKILAEAGLDEEEMRRGAAAGPGGATGQSRNRR